MLMVNILKLARYPTTLSGSWYTYPSEKYEFVSWDDDIPKLWKNKKCSKPPSSNIYIFPYIYIYISTIFLFNGWFAYSPFLHADRCTQNQPASSYLCALWLSRLKLIPLNKHIEHDMFIYVHHRFLGKLSYFTNLNSSAILG